MDVVVIGISFVGFIWIGDGITIINFSAIVGYHFDPRCRCFHEPCWHIGVVSELDAVQEFVGASCLQIANSLHLSDIIVDTGVDHKIGCNSQRCGQNPTFKPIGGCDTECGEDKDIDIIFMIATVLRCPKVDVGDLESHQVNLDVIGTFHRIGTEIDVIWNAVTWVEILKGRCVRSDARIVESKVGCGEVF